MVHSIKLCYPRFKGSESAQMSIVRLSWYLSSATAVFKFFSLFVICVLFHQVAIAEIFGDGIAENGIEDHRKRLSATEQQHYQRFFGTIECEGVVKGTAILLNVGLNDSDRRPVVITAKHVMAERWFDNSEACRYLPAGYPWGQQVLTGDHAKGVSPASVEENHSLHEYANDWIVIAIDPWPNWKNSALMYRFRSDIARDGANRLENIDSGAFIGFDGTDRGFKLDNDCRFGRIEQESPFFGVDSLIWDDCQSVSGSSGGVLYSDIESGMDIIAIRVGTLFDKKVYPKGPVRGAKFDVLTNINVARLVDFEIDLAIRSLLLKSLDQNLLLE